MIYFISVISNIERFLLFMERKIGRRAGWECVVKGHDTTKA